MAYKHDYDKILTRLSKILSKLYAGEALSVTELAREFNVSDRTIQRDLNNRLISFPIYQDGKKWKMQEGFKLEKHHSIEECVVLDIMEGIFVSHDGLFASKAKQLLSKLKNEEFNPIYTKLDIEDISDKLKEIALLEEAIKNRVVIDTMYDMQGHFISITLKPLKIANYEGFWYLIAVDSKDEKLKKYYLKSIKDIKITDEKFKSDTDLEKLLENSRSIWFDDKTKPFLVTLFISSDIAKYIKRKPILKTQKIIKENDDGTLEISVMITHKMEIIPIVKYWMPHIRVLEPRDIIDDIEEDLKRYLKK
jgi:predicted DNA-binding transcriptional regulator YafY